MRHSLTISSDSKSHFYEIILWTVISNSQRNPETLENKLHKIRVELKKNPIDAEKMRDLNNLTLDMTITLNEIENYEDQLIFL